MQYRRLYVPGGCYFFTVVTEKRRKILVKDTTIEILREAFRQVMNKFPFTIDAISVLPDHLHCIWSLPADDQDFSRRWRLIKTWFTKHCDIHPGDVSDKSGINICKQSIWQNRYWEHLIKNQEDYNHHIDYIHYNPVKHGYVNRPFDWNYSSFRRYVEKGIYSENWGAMNIVFPDDVGKE